MDAFYILMVTRSARHHIICLGKLYCLLIFILISIHFISCHATVEFFIFGACVVLKTEVHATHFNMYKVYLQIELDEIFFNPLY
jgi:hypothetical protein